MRAGEKLHIFRTCKNVKFNFNDAQPVLFFSKFLLYNAKTVLNIFSFAAFRPSCLLDLARQILLPSPTRENCRFCSKTKLQRSFFSSPNAATTAIDRMTWLACISHYVRGHVHKTGPGGFGHGPKGIMGKKSKTGHLHLTFALFTSLVTP